MSTRQTQTVNLNLTINSSASKSILQAGDFTFIGSYPFAADNQATYGMGITGRRVNGQQRFLTFDYTGALSSTGHADAKLIEFALPSSIGTHITTLITMWLDIFSPVPPPNIGGGDEFGLWWEDQGNGNDGIGRLWTTSCTDYPADPIPVGSPTGCGSPFCLSVRNINNDGSVSNVHGQWGFYGIGQRAIYGGMQLIPSWLSAQLNNPNLKYLIGWGGYASRMAQAALPGSVPSMGLMVLAIPDPSTYPDETIIPSTDFLILADHRSGTVQSDYNPLTGDRGQRNPNVINEYETPRWASPAPDGFGRFTWGDSFYAAGSMIDGPNKTGLVCIGNFNNGISYYQGSTLHAAGHDNELQIFNPNDFLMVLAGTKNSWNVQPSSTKLLTPDIQPLGLCNAARGGGNPFNALNGTHFDLTTKNLYTWGTGVNSGYGSILVVYKVNC